MSDQQASQIQSITVGNEMDDPVPVAVVDVEMPFFSMVVFMIKWAVASIPAFIILTAVFGVLGLIGSAVFGTVLGGLLLGG